MSGGAGSGRNKFGAKRCECDLGETLHKHDSLAERHRCFVLHQRQAMGEISALCPCPPAWDMTVGGRHVGRYRPDFTYIDAEGRAVLEDVKSSATRRTEAYRLRRKLFEACWAPLTITEVE